MELPRDLASANNQTEKQQLNESGFASTTGPNSAGGQATKLNRLEQSVPPLPVHASGGPRTPRGKARSSENAITHGIFSKVVPLQHESRREFDSLLLGLQECYDPIGTLEETLVGKLAILLWRLRRLLLAESAMVQAQIKSAEETKERSFLPLTDQVSMTLARQDQNTDRVRELEAKANRARESSGGSRGLEEMELLQNAIPLGPRLESLLRYETHLEKAFERTLAQLERLQRIRRGQSVPPEQRVRMTVEP